MLSASVLLLPNSSSFAQLNFYILNYKKYPVCLHLLFNLILFPISIVYVRMYVCIHFLFLLLHQLLLQVLQLPVVAAGGATFGQSNYIQGEETRECDVTEDNDQTVISIGRGWHGVHFLHLLVPPPTPWRLLNCEAFTVSYVRSACIYVCM